MPSYRQPTTQDVARDIFIQKHSNERKERWVSGNFVYFRMNRIVVSLCTALPPPPHTHIKGWPQALPTSPRSFYRLTVLGLWL